VEISVLLTIWRMSRQQDDQAGISALVLAHFKRKLIAQVLEAVCMTLPPD